MERSDRQRFHLLNFARTVLEPARGKLTVGNYIEPYAYGALLEAGGWVCAGVDIGYFPHAESEALLQDLNAFFDCLMPAPAIGALSATLELLIAGDCGAALALRAFDDADHVTLQQLEPAFQAALIQSSTFQRKTSAHEFLARIRFADQYSWDFAFKREKSDKLSWQDCEAGSSVVSTLHDGLLATVHYIANLSQWAAATMGRDTGQPGPSIPCG